MHLTLHVDGANPGHKGRGGAGAVVSAAGVPLLHGSWPLGTVNNNEAEYEALIRGLCLTQFLRPERLTVYTDSQLMSRQLAGIYRVKAANLAPLNVVAQTILATFPDVEIIHIPRKYNEEADALAKQGKQSPEMDIRIFSENISKHYPFHGLDNEPVEVLPA